LASADEQNSLKKLSGYGKKMAFLMHQSTFCKQWLSPWEAVSESGAGSISWKDMEMTTPARKARE
jgi:hypothetical protein